MKVISGKVQKAQRVVVYGPEGIGKSTFASHFPKPIFIDVEGGTNHIDCDRMERPLSFSAIMAEIKDAMHSDYQTIVVDTIDWAERLAVEQICAEGNVSSIEDFGYGKGYTFIGEHIGKLLNLLWEASEHGKHVVLLGHSILKKMERPNESPFDRYEISLTKQVAPMVKKWADMILFINYEYIIFDEKGSTKKKATGGKRVMYAAHNPCWDAKNRDGLPDKMPFEYKSIAGVIDAVTTKQDAKPEKPEPKPEPKQNVKAEYKAEPKAKPEPPKEPSKPADKPKPVVTYGMLPEKLVQLMENDGITAEEIMEVVYERQKGVFPAGMTLDKLPIDFVDGWIIKFWDNIVKMVGNSKDAPF
jgi:energy-coupling factor transporter ATP-binding protein EcfA2